MSASGPVLILAGGTGGHIFPGLAVAQALRTRDVPVAWLGAHGGMETRLVPPSGVPLETIAVAGLRGKGALSLLTAPFRVLRAVWQALAVLRRLRPRAVVSFGGYAAGPGGLAAWLLRRPLLVHEQNAAPGMTNRVLAKFARRVLCGFPGALPAGETVGNPVRGVISALPPPAVRIAAHSQPVRLLVFGGSQGARSLNLALPAVMTRLARGAHPDVRHQAGEKQSGDTNFAYVDAGVQARVEPFISDMAEAYAWADVVVCRAGALTIAELCAAGLPSVLVPFPAAVDDHQTRNAESLVARGAALLVPESPAETFVDRLQAALQPLLDDPPRRRAMAEAARAAAIPDSAERVASIVIEEARA